MDTPAQTPSRFVRRLRLFAFGLVAALVMLVVGYYALYIGVMTRPIPSTPGTTPAERGLRYEDVTLTAEDGAHLAGWYLPSQNGAAIIVLHGYTVNRASMLWHAQTLAEHGYGVLLYDLRAHGQSEGQWRTYGWRDPEDVAAALDFLAARPGVDEGRIGIVGFSMGGQIALRATARYPEIRAVFADGPSLANMGDLRPPRTLGDHLGKLNSWIAFQGFALRTGTRPPEAVTDVIAGIAPRPLMLVHTATEIERVTAEHYYERAQEPKTLWAIPETLHGGGWHARPEEYAEKLLAFFDGALQE